MKVNKYFSSLVLAKTFRRDSIFRRAVAALAAFSFTLNALANPTGMTVQRGHATLSVNGSQLNITAGNGSVLNWQNFNIGAGETTTFNQPSAGAIVWNRINNNQGASQIYGSLHANGVVVLLNSSGFYFGPNSFVSAAGLVVSTANCAPPQNSGGSWVFNGPPPLASIINYGQIKIGNGGDCFLIADKVENHGNIETDGGNIGLAAGKTVTLSERPDGRGMSMNVLLPQGSVDNYGNLIADGGTIALNAKVVNQNGLIQANSVQNKNGVIELVADDSVNLGATSQILAQGDNSISGSAGGNVTIKAGNNFSDAAGSSIVTSGGANGGNGGNVEISAANILSLKTTMNASAQNGFSGGEFLLDPVNIILGSGGIDVNSAFAGFSSIKLQASGNITLADGTSWDLSGSTGQSKGTLTLQAGGDITIGDGSTILDASKWSVSLAAGYNFTKNLSAPGIGSILFNGSGAIQTKTGGINLLAGKDITVGSGYVVTTGGGSINAQALAGNIDTGSHAQGYYFIHPTSTIDDLMPGESPGTMYDLRNGVGGISTEAGGYVNLTAGGNVTSYLPVNNAGIAAMTAGSGAYGKQAGNVNIVAGGDVTGNYLVANGTGKIFAGVKMDANGNPIKDVSGNYALVATVPDVLDSLGKVVPGAPGSAGNDRLSPNLSLDLISGGWNVTAAQDICLQEVVNPNGMFNTSGSASVKHLFDYGLNDYVNLNAGYLVQLGATKTALPRVDTLKVPVIYPGILNVTAGAGGVILKGDSTYNQLILFPSALGSLTINTLDGGSFNGSLPPAANVPQIFNLVVSDSGKQQFQASGDFGLDDHADTPIHHENTTPVELNISGDMNLMQLDSPEAAQINVVGNMNNCRFQGMNLNASDVTSITVGQAAKQNMEQMGLLNPANDGALIVGGDINNRSLFTSVDLSQISGATPPDFSYFDHAVIGNPTPAQLSASFFYNPVTKILTYQKIPGVNLADVLQALQNLSVQVYKNGIPQWADSPDNTIPITTTVSTISSADAQALLAMYNSLDKSQGTIPTGNTGYTIGGGGQFNITAHNMDLGTTPGIQSMGVGYYQDSAGNYPLANLFTTGANIGVQLTGDLNMYSSSIASLNGGGISVFAAGNVNAGSPDFTVNSSGARGIFSAGQGDVSVIANGNISVNGSRIAAYDGGNVTVESLNGNINAGSGGNGYVIVYDFVVDPVTRLVTSYAPTIPGSGILTTTFPNDAGRVVGNILVETPNGNVNASQGGIVQLPLNNTKSPDAIAEVLAGLELHNLHGDILSAANMAQPTIQGIATTASAGDSPNTVIIQNGNSPIKFQVSQSVWSELASTLNISLAANQDLKINLLGGDVAALKSVLTGSGSGLADYNYATYASPLRNIDASGSGVIGNNVKLAATGDILGVIFARNNISLTAQQNVNVVALAQGTVSANAGGALTGTLIGIGGISASGDSITAALDSNNSISGDTSGSKGLAQGTAANATSAAMASDDTAKNSTDNGNGDEDLSKKKKGIALAQKVSRVTVILPVKKLSEKTTANNPL